MVRYWLGRHGRIKTNLRVIFSGVPLLEALFSHALELGVEQRSGALLVTWCSHRHSEVDA